MRATSWGIKPSYSHAANRAKSNHQDSDAAKVGYLIGTWAPVERAYAELLGASGTHGD